MSLVALSVSVSYLFVELRIGERSTGVFAMTPAFALQVVATVSILGTDSVPEKPLGALKSAHSLAAILGFSAVALSNVYAILYLFLYSAIKRGSFGLFYRKMPPLETLSDLNFSATSGAFYAITVMIALGVWRSLVAAPGAEVGSSVLVRPEVILTCVLWLLFGVSIFAKRFFSLGGKRFAYTTLLGLFLLLSIFAGGFFMHGFHE